MHSFCLDNNCETCFERSFKSNPRSEFWSERNKLSPRDVTKKCAKIFEFKCNVCEHYFSSRLNDISSNFSWCPYCGKQKLCNQENCIICREKSFESNPMSKFWSERNQITPRMVFKGSYKKYEFKCDICIHYFYSNLSSINKYGTWCPYCSHTKLCDEDDCQTCYNNSFASHPRSILWSENNKIIPRMVFKNSSKKFEFKCNICNHFFNTRICNFTKKNPTNCPYCSNTNKIICGKKDCEKCYNNSFGSHPKSKFLVDKNIDPLTICKGTNIKLEFKCEKNHIFKSRISMITGAKKGYWCPKCKYKCEEKFYNWACKNYENVIHQYKPQWSKSKHTKKLLPFDFFFPDSDTIIEIDGDQHFRQIWNWNPPEKTQETDLHKMVLALKQGISIMRIPYNYVYNDNNFSTIKQDIKNQLIRRESPKIFLFVNSYTDNRYEYIDKYNFSDVSL